jgi:hypothetical protein
MGRVITSPFGITVMIGVVVLLLAVVAIAIFGLRTVSGESRRARKADALRKIEEVNRVGYLDNMGTIKIDRNRQRGVDDRD